MNRHIPRIALLVGALAVCGQAAAHGGGGGWHGGAGPVLGAAVVGAVVGAVVSGNHDRTVYVERQPAYYGPRRCMSRPRRRCTTSRTRRIRLWSATYRCRRRITASATTARHRCTTDRPAGSTGPAPCLRAGRWLSGKPPALA